MRLIDADALIAQMEADAEQMEEPIAAMFAYAAINDVKHAPTIEPERKKGKWIPQDLNKSYGMISTAVYYYPKCSVCGWNENYTNFCPNCGADMTEDKEDA